MNTELCQINIRAKMNRLTINVKKSQDIVIKKKNICTTFPEIAFNGKVIPYQVPNLGVIVKKTLS